MADYRTPVGFLPNLEEFLVKTKCFDEWDVQLTSIMHPKSYLIPGG
jgi:hypothetical protein